MTFRLMGLGLVFAVVIGWLVHGARDARDDARARVVADQERALAHRADQIERMIQLIYQGGRTIALLPTVRGITGGNRPKGSPEGSVDRARFSPDAELTVQQIYNNLAANVRVSEVYAVMDGFQPERGEIPFFMFDDVRVDGVGDGEDHAEHEDHAKSPDEPEEEEDEEYAYYARLLADLRRTHPRLELAHTALDHIPVYTSPRLRTCDNAQYTSRAHGDVHDAEGFTFSVPIYDRASAFAGIVSVIVRANVFEAALRGDPIVIVTPADRAAAAAAGWTESPPVGYVLRGSGIEIADRRVAIAAARTEQGAAHLHRKLAVPMAEPWDLELHVPAAVVTAGDAAIWRRLAAELAVAVGIAGALAAWLLGRARRERRMGEVVVTLDATSRHVTTSAEQVAHASSELAQGASAQAASIEETSAALEEIATMTRRNAEVAAQVTAQAADTRAHAEHSVGDMTDLVSAMDAIQHSAADIAKIIKVIDDLAFQTNMLALNASVEAARAGEAGLGFAVVADEVRNLAHRSAQAARDSAAQIEESVRRAQHGETITQRVARALAEITQRVRSTDELVRTIVGASQEQARGIAQTNSAVAMMDRVTQRTAAVADDASRSASALHAHASELRALATTLVGQFGARTADAPVEAAPPPVRAARPVIHHVAPPPAPGFPPDVAWRGDQKIAPRPTPQ